MVHWWVWVLTIPTTITPKSSQVAKDTIVFSLELEFELGTFAVPTKHRANEPLPPQD
jgi:hypothetical protein